jgi:hypothetical protein
MDEAERAAQGFHAALIGQWASGWAVKHFRRLGPEMLQEIRKRCVDLAARRP